MDIRQPLNGLIAECDSTARYISSLDHGRTQYQLFHDERSEAKQKLYDMDNFVCVTRMFRDKLQLQIKLTPVEDAFYREFYGETSRTYHVLQTDNPLDIENLIENGFLHGVQIKKDLEMNLKKCEN